MADVELYQFQGSHYNEKARWGLEWKAVPHEKISLLPGPHMRTMKKLTGKTEVPVLRAAGTVVPGSAQILAHLEASHPDPPLFPADPAERERALEIVERFDREVGPAVRLAKFFEVIDGEYATGTFGRGQPALKRAFYRATFPLVGNLMKRMMGIDAANAAAAREITREAFEFVAKESAATGYLVGGRFTVADLTCAALLMPCVPVDEWGGPFDAQTEKNRAWLARWTDHPGAEWVREIYRRHRLRSSAA